MIDGRPSMFGGRWGMADGRWGTTDGRRVTIGGRWGTSHLDKFCRFTSFLLLLFYFKDPFAFYWKFICNHSIYSPISFIYLDRLLKLLI